MIHHIAIGTKNLDQMISFYESIPCLVRTKTNFYENGKIRSVWFSSDEILLMLEDNETNIAPLALVFSLKSMTEIIKLNLKIEKKTQYTIYFYDPDRNMLGFSSYPNNLEM
jgi:catechol 2,3-dioxygenase-like lactoylglutathione lyase family enzyme